MPDTPVAPASGEPYDPSIAIRVSRLEMEMREERAARSQVEAAIIRIEAILPHLATRADIADLRADVARDATRLEVALADKPSKLYMWGVLTALLTAYACGLAALAILK